MKTVLTGTRSGDSIKSRRNHHPGFLDWHIVPSRQCRDDARYMRRQ